MGRVLGPTVLAMFKTTPDPGVAMRAVIEDEERRFDPRRMDPEVRAAALDDICDIRYCSDPDCWYCRSLRKRAAIATVGFEVGLVKFDWPAGRSVRITVDHAAYFPVGTGFVTFDAGAYGEARGYEVFAVDGDELRAVPRP